MAWNKSGGGCGVDAVDRPADFKPGRKWQFGLFLVGSAHHEQVGEIDPCSFDLDADFAWSQFGKGCFDEFQGQVVFLQLHGAHGGSNPDGRTVSRGLTNGASP